MITQFIQYEAVSLWWQQINMQAVMNELFHKDSQCLYFRVICCTIFVQTFLHAVAAAVSERTIIQLLRRFCNVTRRMAIANGTCVSFCNQPKAKFGSLRRVTSVCRCLHLFCRWIGHLATARESKPHFGLPGHASGTMLDGKRTQCWSNASQHVTFIFNRLRAIARYLQEIATFSYLFAFNAPIGCSHWNSGEKFGPHKTKIMALPLQWDRRPVYS